MAGPYTDPAFIRFWAMATVASNVPTLQKSFNVDSITDTNTGQLTVTITRDFDSANWCCQATVERELNTDLAIANLRFVAVRKSGLAAGTVLVECWDGTGTTALAKDPASWHVSGFGAQV